MTSPGRVGLTVVAVVALWAWWGGNPTADPRVASPYVQPKMVIRPVAKPGTAPVAAPSTQDATLSRSEAAAAVHPVHLTIAALGVDADIVGAGLDANTGDLDLPPNVDRVAWYRLGSVPGDDGGSLLAAHVDFNGREGLFFHLSELTPGAELQVRNSDGVERSFAVVAVRPWSKAELPIERLAGAQGEARLSLVTCGGKFDRRTRHYEDNIVVTAVPV